MILGICFISHLFVLLCFFIVSFTVAHICEVSISFAMYRYRYSLSDHKYQSCKNNLIRCPFLFILYSPKKADKPLWA
uniref:Putative secreted protein n=1 Tax=Ixodes ricinus TaxID=34613 RepID=A0A147BPP1_IXORI